mgnify:CR=1 FL=1
MNIYLILINILGFFLILIDKIKARKKEWRIRENSLIFLAIIGAGPGELISMLMFHHKTKKNKFIILIPIIIIVQIIIYLNVNDR